jgi:hypothetical protein
VGLERGPLSLMSITEELLEWKSSGSGSRKPSAVGIRCTDHAKVGTKLSDKRRSLGRKFRLLTKAKKCSFSSVTGY